MIFRPKHKILLVVSSALLLLGISVWLTKSEPLEQPDDGWKTTTNSQGITFGYPEQLSTTYISVADWPPIVTVTDGPFSCTEAGEEIARAGKTEKLMIDGREYCVTKVSEGAAGSIYTQYSYITPTGNNNAVNLTFTLRFVRCINYDEAQKLQCEEERMTFDIDSVIDRIVKTI